MMKRTVSYFLKTSAKGVGMEPYFQGILSKLFCLATEMRSALKGNNLLPFGANCFLLEKTPFSKVAYAGRQTRILKVISLVKSVENLPSVSNS